MSPYDHQAGPGIGATLKDARRRLGMDIKEAEDRTKIRSAHRTNHRSLPTMAARDTTRHDRADMRVAS